MEIHVSQQIGKLLSNKIQELSKFNNKTYNFHLFPFPYFPMSRNLTLERQLHTLAQQNQVLRAKTQKIHQIQSYVNILIQSSQSSQEQLNRSHQQNRSLKIQVDQLMAESVKLEKHYEHELDFMQADFKRQLIRKDEQMRALSSTRDKQCQMYQQKLSQHQTRSRNQIQRLKLQFYSLQQQCQDQIHQLSALVQEKSHNLQLHEDSKNQLKKAYMEEANNMSMEVAKLQRAYNQNQDQVFRLKEELTRMGQVVGQMSDNQALIKRQLARKQEENLNDRKVFQKKIRTLQQTLNELTAKQKKTLLKLNQTSIYNQKLIKQISSLSDQLTDIKHQSSKLQRLINQKDQQIKQLTLKIEQQEEQHRRHLKRHNEQLQRAQEELNLASERFLCEKRNSDAMKGQIQDLLKVIDKLQANLSQSEHNLQMVNKQNSVLFKQVENITKELKYRIQELNDIDAKYKQSRENYLGLEEIYKKQCIKSHTLNNQNAQIISRLESITREQKSLQEQELSNLIEKHLAQKRQMLETHRVEKEAMAKKFQQALREKDQQLKKRLQLLEDQISLMRVRH